jgi:predicted N-formylglutamate amidohydrolase
MIQGEGAVVGALSQSASGAHARKPVVVENARGGARFVVLCDHAANFIPPEYADLGLGPKERAAHIAWDPGALPVSRSLSRALDAPLVFTTVSRLVIDCNRPLDAPDLIAETSEDTPVPGNRSLPQVERRRRIAAVHDVYHDAIDELIEARLAAGRPTALVAIHSFTPIYRRVARPWPVGVIFDRDRSLSDPLIDALRGEGLTVGVNEPYSPADRVYYTLERHAGTRGLPSVMIEIRNDLIAGPAGQAEWSARLARALHALQGAERAA